MAIVGLVAVLLIVSVIAFLRSGDNQAPPVDTTNQITQMSYIAYDEGSLDLANDNNLVLFFNASWCPTCRIAHEHFSKQAGDGNFPDNLVIMNVDYDDNQALRQQYGVTGQHTYVQVDADGNFLKTWLGSYTVNQVLQELAT